MEFVLIIIMVISFVGNLAINMSDYKEKHEVKNFSDVLRGLFYNHPTRYNRFM